MEKYIIDRVEGNFFVLESENGITQDIPLSEIPRGKEGDVVTFKNGEYHIEPKETLRRKKLIEEKMRRLFGKE